MILTLLNKAQNALYDFCMESVWQAYGARTVNLLPIKINPSDKLTQDGQNLNKLLNTSDRDGSQR